MNCSNCDDTLLPNARFCITCGQVAPAVGATERLDSTITKQPISEAGLTALCRRAFECGAENVVIAIHPRDTFGPVRELPMFIPALPVHIIPSVPHAWAYDDHLVGIYGAAEIWIKPWAVQGYACMQEAT